MGRQPRSKRTMAADGKVVVAGKNPNGKGSVYFAAASRRADGTEVPGRWRASYLGNDGQRHVVSGPTRAIVEARRDEILQQLARRPAPSRFDRHTTVDQLVDWWLGSVAKHQVKQSTLDSYTKFALYLTAELGSMRAVDVGAEALTAWQSRLLDSFAPYTVLNCRKVCRQVFQEAVKVGLLASNPFDMVKAPKAKTVNVTKALSIEQAQRLVTAAADYRLGAAVTLLFCQGWRISEVLGLAWEDLDLDAGTARIQRAAAYSPSTGVTRGAPRPPAPKASTTSPPSRLPTCGLSESDRRSSVRTPDGNGSTSQPPSHREMEAEIDPPLERSAMRAPAPSEAPAARPGHSASSGRRYRLGDTAPPEPVA